MNNSTRTNRLSIAALLHRHSLCLLALAVSATHAQAQEVIWEHVGVYEAGERQAHNLRPLHDVDGDGVRDFLSGTTGPMHFILSGSTGDALIRYRGPDTSGVWSSHGIAADNIGDFDGDGVDDYAVGAPHHTDPLSSQGIVRIFSGVTHKVMLELPGQYAGQQFGSGIVGLGDINGDGYADFAANGGGGISSTFEVFLFAGPDAAVIRHYPFDQQEGFRKPERFVDFNGDGAQDYLLGRPLNDTNAFNCGAIDVCSGIDGSVLLSMDGLREWEMLGERMGPAGDWNGDGIEDIVAGATGPSNGVFAMFHGVYVFSGADGSILRFHDGVDFIPDSANQISWPAFGASVASGRDVTGDGFPDIVVGAPLDSSASPLGGHDLGTVFVFSGATGSLIWKAKGVDQAGGSRIGFQVSILDDRNGDGLADWTATAPAFRPADQLFGTPMGKHYMFAGAPAEVESICQGGTNSTGESARLWNSGGIGLRANNLVLEVDDLPPNAPGILVFGTDIPPQPFGSGELCVAAGQLFIQAATANSTGDAQLTVDLFAAPFPQFPNQLRAGDTGTFQFLYRDGAQRNTTNALRVLFPN